MKYLIIIIVLQSFLYQPLLYPQDTTSNLIKFYEKYQEVKTKSESKISEIDTTYYPASDIGIKNSAMSKYISELPADEFLNIISFWIKAFEEDLFKPVEFMKNRAKSMENYTLDSVSIRSFELDLFRRLRELYGESISDLVYSPLILRIKVLKIETRMFSSLLGFIVTAEIEDIIKGQTHFNIGQIFNFYYMPGWFRLRPIKFSNFSINDSYFISLLSVSKNHSPSLALHTNPGIIIIKDEIVLDSENYFGFGSKPWQIFKEELNKELSKVYKRDD